MEDDPDNKEVEEEKTYEVPMRRKYTFLRCWKEVDMMNRDFYKEVKDEAHQTKLGYGQDGYVLCFYGEIFKFSPITCVDYRPHIKCLGKENLDKFDGTAEVDNVAMVNILAD